MSAEATNEFPALKPGRFVSVKIIPEDSQKCILVPESALEKIGDDYYLYRLVEGLAVRTMVTIGMRKKGYVEIITGVNEGETVVTAGQNGVIDGKGVSIQTPESLERMRQELLGKIAELKKKQASKGKKDKNKEQASAASNSGDNSSDQTKVKKKKKKKKKKAS